MSLFDEFTRVAVAEPWSFPAKCEPCPAFGDLIWDSPPPSVQDLLADPGLTARTELRQMALLRVRGEIRYYLGLAPGSHDHRYAEMGVASSVEDAVALGREFFLGRLPAEIEVPRTSYSDVPALRHDREKRIDPLRPVLESLTRRSAESIDLPGDGFRPWVRLYLHRDFPQEGQMTVFSLGASSASWPKWGVRRPECLLTVRSLDAAWALALGEVIQAYAHQSEFRVGEVLDLDREIAPHTSMSAFRLETAWTLPSQDLELDLPDRALSFVQAYPIRRDELFVVYDARPLAAQCSAAGVDPLSPTRAPLPAPRGEQLSTDEWSLQYLLNRIDSFWIRMFAHAVWPRAAEAEAWWIWLRLTSPRFLEVLRRRGIRLHEMNGLAASLHRAALMEAESRSTRRDEPIRASRAEVLAAVRALTLGDGYPGHPIL